MGKEQLVLWKIKGKWTFFQLSPSLPFLKALVLIWVSLHLQQLSLSLFGRVCLPSLARASVSLFSPSPPPPPFSFFLVSVCVSNAPRKESESFVPSPPFFYPGENSLLRESNSRERGGK